MIDTLEFYKGKRVFVTGCTGFKGSWLCQILIQAGADVYGYAMEPPTTPSLFELNKLGQKINTTIADIRDYQMLYQAFEQARPEIVFHLAAQPIVREGYRDPVGTYETNVMGTVNLLECVRKMECVHSVINVTTDKVYDNKEWVWGYREDEVLDGFDPYSNSKSCSELVTHSYVRSFLHDMGIAVSTMRAGNVIGGGDFAPDRIIPDCIRSVMENEPIEVRNPYSIRPYQHVLEPLSAYLELAARQYEQPVYAGCYNVGPDERDCIRTGELATLFCESWGKGACWKQQKEIKAVHEANFLRLDSSKLKATLGWKPLWSVQQAVQKTVQWTQCWMSGGNVADEMRREINEYYSCYNKRQQIDTAFEAGSCKMESKR